MKIVEVNYTDLGGRVFNGYDLMQELNKRGQSVKQIVLEKKSNNKDVISVGYDSILHYQLLQLGKEYSLNNVILPYGIQILEQSEFQNADLIHFHILHNNFVSLLDYPELINNKKCVWTIHDPWILTGNCVHPLECEKWKQGCKKCQRIEEAGDEVQEDNTALMWEIKKNILLKINPHIVVSSKFMADYIKESPLTKHWNKIHCIPFGIDVHDFLYENKKETKRRLGFDESKLLIGFRADKNPIKGCKYIYDALRTLETDDMLQLTTVGTEKIPEDIRKRYKCRECGWMSDEEKLREWYRACDVFLMPSLAESFGLMAVEAMAEGAVVVCFEGTSVEKIINAPQVGLSTEYQVAKGIADKISMVLHNEYDLEMRSRAGVDYVRANYSFDKYVEKHLGLYCEIMKE